jgi:hypothetical protein
LHDIFDSTCTPLVLKKSKTFYYFSLTSKWDNYLRNLEWVITV